MITNSNTRIDQVNTALKSQITLESNHHAELGKLITDSNTRIDQVSTALNAQIKLEASHKSGLDKKIASIEITANDLGSEIKLKADKTTIDSKITKINGRLETDEANIKTLQVDVANVETLIAEKIKAITFESLIAKATVIKATIAISSGVSVSAPIIAAGTSMTVNKKSVATQEWVNNKGFLTDLPSSPTFSHVKATDGMSIGVYKVATQYWVNQNFATQDWVKEQLKSYASSSHKHDWGDITGKPSSFTPAKHKHNFSASTTAANGHTHTVKIGSTEYTTKGVSTNATHTIKISGTTDNN